MEHICMRQTDIISMAVITVLSAFTTAGAAKI